MDNSFFIVIILIFFLLIITPVFAEVSYNNSFCKNEDRGVKLLGGDFYLFCEKNLEDAYFSGMNKSDYVRPIEIVEDEKPVSLEPKNLFEYLSLQRAGYKKSEMNLSQEMKIAIEEEKPVSEINLQKQIFHSNTSLGNETKLIKKNVSFIKNKTLSNLDNSTDRTSSDLNESNNKISPENTNPGALLDLETRQHDPVGSNDSFIQNYLLYLGVGLFILLILYIGIHTLERKHSEKKEIAVACSYVELLRKQNYTDQQIKQFFIQKGYEESFINKVLKTQDFNP